MKNDESNFQLVHEGGVHDVSLGEIVTGQEQYSLPPERKEGTESLESRCAALENDWQAQERERELTYLMSSMQTEGFQTLISEYGIERVFDIIDKLKTTKRGGRLTILEVICALEPSESSRDIFYEKIISDSEEQAKQYDQGERGTDGIPVTSDTRESRDYFESRWGNGGNYARNAQFRVATMRRLDTVLGKLIPGRDYNILDSRINQFALNISHTEDRAKIKEDLSQAGNDTIRLVESKHKNSNEQAAFLRIKGFELRQALGTEIQRITTEHNLELEEYRARVVGDIGKVMGVETASKEMQAALQGVLQQVESDIALRSKETQKEIDEKTSLLRQMVSKIGALEAHYY